MNPQGEEMTDSFKFKLLLELASMLVHAYIESTMSDHSENKVRFMQRIEEIRILARRG